MAANPDLMLATLIVLAGKTAGGEIDPQQALEAGLKLAVSGTDALDKGDDTQEEAIPEEEGIEGSEPQPPVQEGQKGIHAPQGDNAHPDERIPLYNDPNLPPMRSVHRDVATRPNTMSGKRRGDLGYDAVHYTDTRGRYREPERGHDDDVDWQYPKVRQQSGERLAAPDPNEPPSESPHPQTSRRTGPGVSPTVDNAGNTGRRVRADVAEQKTLSSVGDLSGGALVAPPTFMGKVPRSPRLGRSKLLALHKGLGPNQSKDPVFHGEDEDLDATGRPDPRVRLNRQEPQRASSSNDGLPNTTTLEGEPLSVRSHKDAVSPAEWADNAEHKPRS